jgi:hypothetical protein
VAHRREQQRHLVAGDDHGAAGPGKQAERMQDGLRIDRCEAPQWLIRDQDLRTPRDGDLGAPALPTGERA